MYLSSVSYLPDQTFESMHSAVNWLISHCDIKHLRKEKKNEKAQPIQVMLWSVMGAITPIAVISVK